MKATTLLISNSIARPRTHSGFGFIVIAFALVWFEIAPLAEAVLPAPDGGYPGGNTAEGQAALLNLTTGGFNTAVGFLSLRSNTTNSFNTAIGAGALLANTADNNTATGGGTLLSNTTGAFNTATGTFALFTNTTGNNNTATGANALVSNTIGFENTATSSNALSANTTGFGNTAVGYGALGNSTTGSTNIALGLVAGLDVTTADNVICIGHVGQNVSNTTWIKNIYGITTVSGITLPVMVSDQGQLGTVSSSRQFKKDIKPMEKASEAILALKPVTFHYKSDDSGTPQFGLIAEEVAEVNPDLVVRDENGEIYTVRYDAVNAMLLNEFLKEHRKLKEQEATITDLNKKMETVVAHLREQDSKIQRVSDQFAAASPSRG